MVEKISTRDYDGNTPCVYCIHFSTCEDDEPCDSCVMVPPSNFETEDDSVGNCYTAAVVLRQVNPCAGCRAPSPDSCHRCTFTPSEHK
jgi:hypothetical protein